jgi:hypothetical protein
MQVMATRCPAQPHWLCAPVRQRMSPAGAPVFQAYRAMLKTPDRAIQGRRDWRCRECLGGVQLARTEAGAWRAQV